MLEAKGVLRGCQVVPASAKVGQSWPGLKESRLVYAIYLCKHLISSTLSIYLSIYISIYLSIDPLHRRLII